MLSLPDVLVGGEARNSHRSEVFRILRDLVAACGREIALGESPRSDPFLIMTKIVGSMDPESLKKLAEAVPDVMVGAAKAQESAPPGLWETFRMLRNKNLRRGVAVANNVLEALGRNSSTQKS